MGPKKRVGAAVVKSAETDPTEPNLIISPDIPPSSKGRKMKTRQPKAAATKQPTAMAGVAFSTYRDPNGQDVSTQDDSPPNFFTAATSAQKRQVYIDSPDNKRQKKEPQSKPSAANSRVKNTIISQPAVMTGSGSNITNEYFYSRSPAALLTIQAPTAHTTPTATATPLAPPASEPHTIVPVSMPPPPNAFATSAAQRGQTASVPATLTPSIRSNPQNNSVELVSIEDGIGPQAVQISPESDRMSGIVHGDTAVTLRSPDLMEIDTPNVSPKQIKDWKARSDVLDRVMQEVVDLKRLKREADEQTLEQVLHQRDQRKALRRKVKALKKEKRQWTTLRKNIVDSIRPFVSLLKVIGDEFDVDRNNDEGYICWKNLLKH